MLTNQEFLNNIDKYEDLVFGFAMKLCKNRTDAKDLYQETITKAFANLSKFQKGTHFKAWVTTIMRNSFINQYRKRRTRNNVEFSADSDFSLLDHVTDNESPSTLLFRKELNEIIRALPIQHRKPFMMKYEGYPYQEIADEMGVPVGTIKSRIHFAKKSLQATVRSKFGIRKVA